jgi:probable rRNA maturation factor
VTKYKHKIYVRSTLPSIGIKLDIRLLRRCIRTALDAERVDILCEISVLITDNDGIRLINKEFRKKDIPTDVLSFPMQELIAGRFEPDMTELNRDSGCLPLGDIVLSADRIAEQSVQFGQSMNREMAYLAIHSVLHLLGYDHMDESAEKHRMRAREEEILRACSLSGTGVSG